MIVKAAIAGVALMVASAGNGMAQSQALNVTEWSSAVEILQEAKVRLEEGDWHQGNPEAVPSPICLSTALERAWEDSEKSLVDFDYARMAVDEVLQAPNLQKLSLESDPLSTPYWGRYYMYWNNAEGRTKEDVMEALDTAVRFAEKRGAAAVEASATGKDLQRFDSNMMRVLGLDEADDAQKSAR